MRHYFFSLRFLLEAEFLILARRYRWGFPLFHSLVIASAVYALVLPAATIIGFAGTLWLLSHAQDLWSLLDVDNGPKLYGFLFPMLLILTVGMVLVGAAPGPRRRLWISEDRRVLRHAWMPLSAVITQRVIFPQLLKTLPLWALALGAILAIDPSSWFIVPLLLGTGTLCCYVCARSLPPRVTRRGFVCSPWRAALVASCGAGGGIAVVLLWRRIREGGLPITEISRWLESAGTLLEIACAAALLLGAICLSGSRRATIRATRFLPADCAEAPKGLKLEPVPSRGWPEIWWRLRFMATIFNLSSLGGAVASRGLFRALSACGWLVLGLSNGVLIAGGGAWISIFDGDLVGYFVSFSALCCVLVATMLGVSIGIRARLAAARWRWRAGDSIASMWWTFWGGYMWAAYLVLIPLLLGMAVLIQRWEAVVFSVVAPAIAVLAMQLAALWDPRPMREADGSVQPGLVGVILGPVLIMASQSLVFLPGPAAILVLAPLPVLLWLNVRELRKVMSPCQKVLPREHSRQDTDTKQSLLV